MTPTRERRTEAPTETEGPAWAQRSAFGIRGVPVWGTVLISVAATAIGTVVDAMLANGPGMTMQIAFFLGSLIAVGMAQRGSLFGPMVQAPLVLVLVVPLVVFITGGGGGGSGLILSIANPLINSFPVMAGTIVATVGVGLLRMRMLEPEASKEHQNLDETVEHATLMRERGKKPERGQKPERGERDRKSSDRRTSSGGKRPERERSDSARQRGSGGRNGRTNGEAPKNRNPSNGDVPSRGVNAGRGNPPGRGGTPRSAPGRGRPPETRPKGEPPKRPQRPRPGE